MQHLLKISSISLLFALLTLTSSHSLAQVLSVGDEAIITATGARIRSGPSVNTAKISLFPNGTTFKILDVKVTNKGTWYQVDTPKGKGWVNFKLATSTKGDLTPPRPIAPVVPPSPNRGSENSPPEEKKNVGTGTDVLYVGDSHSVGCFGTALDNAMRRFTLSGRSNPLRVESVATCGTSTRSWLSGPNKTKCGYRECGVEQTTCSASTKNSGKNATLNEMLTSKRPRLTVIALGTNDLQKGYSKAEAIAETLALIEQVKASGSQCLWVGPPQEGTAFISLDKFEKFRSALQTAVENAGCKFADSSKYSDRNKITDPMHIHYGCKAATAWGNGQYEGVIKGDLEQVFGASAEAGHDVVQ